MRLTRDDLERLQREPGRLPPRSARGCPEGETLRRAAAGELEPPARQALADHLVACPDCAAELQLLDELRGWSQEVASESGVAPASGRSPRAGAPRWAWAAAAAVAVALGATYLFAPVGGPRLEPAPERGSPPLTFTSEPPAGALLPAAPRRFSWSAVDGAQAYEVALFDAESTLLWTSTRVAVPALEMPPEVRERLRAGEVYFWRVTAHVGPERRRLPVREFELRP